MKRFFLLLLTILLLTGCGTNPPDVTQPTTETEPTAATLISWVEDAGMDWDRDGILKEIPLTIPDGLHYSSAMEFDGDLLLWSVDNHLADTQFVEMCLIELDTGSIIAQEDVAVSGYAYPQVAGDILYICDTEGDSNLKLNTILKLNKSLNITDKWSIGDLEGLFYMSANGTIYHLRNEDNLFFRHDSETGEALPVLEGNPTVDWVQESDGILTIRYYDLSTGAPAFAIVDLHTEAIYLPQTDEQIDTLRWKNGTWLYEKYLGYYIYYIQNGDAQPLRFMSEDRSLNLLPRSEILAVDMNGGTVSLYQLDGTHISTCEVFENGSGYVDPNLIWNDTLGGYFMLANSYDETFRLLFWDLSQSLEGENLVLEQIPEPDQIQTALEEKELARAIQGFLQKQSKQNRILFLRRYYFLESVKEIAQQTGYSEALIKSSLLRTRQKLKSFLIKEGWIDER